MDAVHETIKIGAVIKTDRKITNTENQVEKRELCLQSILYSTMHLPWLKYAESDQNAGWYKAGYGVHLRSNYVQ